MLKNKYIFWVVVGIWTLALAGGGVWFWHKQHTSASKQLSRASVTADAGKSQSSQTQSGQSYTLTPTQTPANNPTIPSGAGQGSGTVAGASTTDASKLLDPTSFAQYDKYKSDQNAYFIDLAQGTGAALGNNQKAAVFYRGWLTNGTLFDQSKAGSDGQLQPLNLPKARTK